MRTDITLEPSSNIPDNEEKRPDLGRRGFLRWVAGGAGALALAPELLKAVVLNERYLLFYNPNTGENIRQVYWTPRDGYVREAIGEISWALRDHHNNQVKSFDPNVLDQLYALQLQLGLGQPVNVISGYRSPSTNWRLAEGSRRVARNSYHMQAMALDIRVPGGRAWDLCRAARSLGAGGVGYYPRSNFVHIDCGPVRYWS
jgi:uncharacterized protein YcbK (DUF882 family)